MAMESNIIGALTPELIRIAREELGETDETRTQGIKELMRRVNDGQEWDTSTSFEEISINTSLFGENLEPSNEIENILEETPQIRKPSSKRKRHSLKEIIKNTITTATEKFLEFEERVFAQNEKFQKDFLDVEKKKLELLEKFFNK